MAQLLQASTINPSGLARGAQVSPTNFYERGADTARKAIDAEAARAAAAQKEGMDRQIKAYEAMIENPEMAPVIAQQYGVRFDENIAQLLKHPRQARMAVEGAKMAKDLGITNADTTGAFVGAYIQSGGDHMKALGEVQAMDKYKPQQYKPESRYERVGKSLIDMQTMQPVFSEEEEPKYTEPYKNPNLPVELQMEGLNLSKKQFGRPEDFQEWAKKVADYQATTQGAAPPPPSGVVPDGAGWGQQFYGSGATPPPAPPPPSEPTNVPTIPLPPMLPPERSSQIRQQYGY